MKRILAAVDMTPGSKLVFDAASALAVALDGRVRLVHVIVPPTPFAPAPGMMPATGVDPVPGLVARARDELARLGGALSAERRDGSVVLVGTVAETVVRVVGEERPDLVVIGAHEHGAIARVLGTTAARIVNRVRAPVLVVRSPAGFEAAKRAPLRILAAVDTSDTADAVIAHAVALARMPGATVRVLRVLPHLDQAKASFSVDAAATDLELDRLAAEIPPEHRGGITIARGDPPASICAIAKDYEADVVVIGAHAYRWIERALGTTAAWVVDRIDRPLLVVRDASRIGASIELRGEHQRLDRIALEAQHRDLRERLDTLAVAIDLHSVVLHDAEEMVAALRQHAAREEESFDPWLDVPIPPAGLDVAHERCGQDAPPASEGPSMPGGAHVGAAQHGGRIARRGAEVSDEERIATRT